MNRNTALITEKVTLGSLTCGLTTGLLSLAFTQDVKASGQLALTGMVIGGIVGAAVASTQIATETGIQKALQRRGITIEFV